MGEAMQQVIAPSDAETRAPGWYLARGDKEYGPLTDRELTMLAERGGVKTEDRLWRPGLDGWQPVAVMAGLTQGAEKSEAPAPKSSQVAVVPSTEPTPEVHSRSRHIKAIAVAELKSFIAIFIYLWLVFTVFLIHEWVVLANSGISFRFYGLAAINALVLAKIMLIAEKLRFAERFESGPLVYPIAYKSILFAVLLLVAYVVEEVLVGVIHGGGIADSVPRIGGGSAVGLVAVTAIMCAALVPFFGFREIGRAVGPDAFRSLVFGAATPRWWPSLLSPSAGDPDRERANA
jgi:GYF domain 2